MKTYTTITKRVVDKTYCDKCNKELDTDPENAFSLDFNARFGRFEHDTIEDEKTVTIDLCESCTKKLFKVMIDNGFFLLF